MMRILEFLVERSTFALLVIGAVVALVGVPKEQSRYRALLALVCLLCVGAAVEWYLHLVIAQMYYRDEAHWYFFPLAALFVIAFAAVTWEFATLRIFIRRKKEPDQPPAPTH